MAWWNEFDSVFWITTLTILTGSIGLALKYCLKSKCHNFSICWGCVSVNRNVEVEVEEEMRAMELGLPHTSERDLSLSDLRFKNNIETKTDK